MPYLNGVLKKLMFYLIDLHIAILEDIFQGILLHLQGHLFTNMLVISIFCDQLSYKQVRY